MASLQDAISNTAKNITNTVGKAINTVFSSNSEGVRGTNGYGVQGSAWNAQGDGGGDYGYPWGYGGGGFSGSGGGKTPEEVQEETQASIDDATDNYLGRAGDLSDLGIQNLNNIAGQREQNTNLLNANRRQNMRQVEWQPPQQRVQSTLGALKTRAGNGLYGSGLTDLMEGVSRVDDMSDVQLINTWKQNENAAYNNWFQANEDLISDYIDQMTAIQDEFSKLYSQYWSTMANINPKLFSKENMEKAKKGESVTVGEGTDAYTLPSLKGIKPSDELQALLKAPERASAVNPYTRDFIRPDRAVTAARAIPNTGSANRSTAANQGYLDNLDIYQRRV